MAEYRGIITLTSTPCLLSSFGSAPITSARPPVFTNGTHSEARNSTLYGGCFGVSFISSVILSSALALVFFFSGI